MKQLFYPAIFAGLMLGISACSDDDIIGDDGNPDDENPEVVTIPTEDQMTERCHVPVVVIGDGFNELSKAFLRRVDNLQTELTEDAKVIFFKGEDIYKFTVEQLKTLDKAYKNGAIFAIEEPKEKQILDLAVKITAPEFAAGFSGEEYDVHFADLMAYNTLRDKQYILYDIFDDDPVSYNFSTETQSSDSATPEETESGIESNVQEEIELTPYTLGLYADEFSKWLNNIDNKDARSIQMSRQLSRSTSLDQIVDAQQVTHTYSFTPQYFDQFPATSKDIKGHSVPITINYFIYGVYSFSKYADYYLIDQEISICNSPIWRGSGNGEKGMTLLSVNFDAHITGIYGAKLSRADGCIILNHSPNTTTNTSTITTTSSYSLSGNLGFSITGKGPSVSGGYGGGVSWGVNHTSSLPDVTVINHVMDNPEFENNAHWTYNIQYNDPHENGLFKKAVFGDTPEVAKSTFHTYNTWIWQIDHPERYGVFRLVEDKLEVKYMWEKFVKNNAVTGAWETSRYSITPNYDNSIILTRPYRNTTTK